MSSDLPTSTIRPITLRRSTLLLAAATLLTACGTETTTDETTTAPTTATPITKTAITETVTTAADAASCDPDAFIVGDLGDPVVEYCDGAFAKVNQAGTDFSIVFQAVDGQWDIYPQHGFMGEGMAGPCYSPAVLDADGAAPELQELIPLCGE